MHKTFETGQEIVYDRERTNSPLVRAKDAVVVDSTAMEAEEVARLVVMLAKEQAIENAL